MSLEKFLHFLMAHNATIIEVLLGLTLLVILFLSIRIFLVAKEPESSGGSLDLGNLETTLKQLLEKAGQVPVTAGAGSSEDSQRLVTEISNLKMELENKQKQIEDMKSSPAGGGSAGADAAAAGLSNEDKSKLEAQIQELQAKLSEYEIISEDIADLSFYKEQNVKLQKELETLKSAPATAAPAPAAVAPAAAAPAPTPAPEPAPVAKPEPEIVGKSQVEEAPAAEPPVADNTVDDDLMAEFAAAVEKQKSAEAEPAAEAAPAAEPVAAVEPVPATEPTVDLGQLDMDKMLAEAATIKSDVPDVDPEKALGTSLDEDKLLQEAAALEGVTPEDKKLMGEFENFVKKNE